MYIKYRNKDFVGFDDVRHKDLYNRYNNLKKVKDDLLKDGYNVGDYNVYKNIFDRYDLYDSLNRKILKLINLYRKENLNEQIDKLNLKYKQKIDSIVDNGQNKSQIHIFVRLFWTVSFFNEYFMFVFLVLRRNFLNATRKGKRIN